MDDESTELNDDSASLFGDSTEPRVVGEATLYPMEFCLLSGDTNGSSVEGVCLLIEEWLILMYRRKNIII